MKLPSIEDFSLEKKTVLVRVDLDVPLRKAQISNLKSQILEVADDTRLRNCLPTIEYLLEQNCRVVLLGHLGRPGGKVVPGLSLKPVADRLGKMVGRKVGMIREIGEIREDKGEKGKNGGKGEREKIVMLENLRFWPGEEANDERFTKQLASLGEFFVNECFSTSHRQHASFVGIPKFLPHAAGFHLLKEVEVLSGVLGNPKRPVIVILGGEKTETKVPVIEGLFDKVDIFLLGGVVANTFMRAEKNHPKNLGRSKVDEGQIEEARRILSIEKGQKVRIGDLELQYRIKMPIDLVISKKVGDSRREVIEVAGKTGDVFDQNLMVVDVGPKTLALYSEIIKRAGTVVWSGPLGIEKVGYSLSCGVIGKAMVESGAFTVAGGGDTEAALTQFGLTDKMDWISSGGGAMLEFLAEGTLVGVEALKR